MRKNVAIVYFSGAVAWLLSLVVALSVTLADGTLGSIIHSWLACGVLLVSVLGGCTTVEYVLLKEYE